MEKQIMESVSQIVQAVGYILLLIVLVVFWALVVRRREPRNFWRVLALALTMNLLGNIAWAIYDFVTGSALDTFSPVDLFFVLRYALVAAALWFSPTRLSRKTETWIGAAAVIAAVLVWVVYFRPAMTMNGGDWVSFLGLALYPMLDASLIVLAWRRMSASRESFWHRNALLLFCAVTSYGIANTLNLTEYVFPPLSHGMLPNIFWILADVFLLIMALGAGSKKKGTRD